MRLSGYTWNDPDVVESFQSEPNDHLQPEGKQVDVLVGHTLGGSSCINAAQWTQPDPKAWLLRVVPWTCYMLWLLVLISTTPPCCRSMCIP